MTVFRASELVYDQPRLFPFEAADSSQSGYVDFVENPDRIETALEDFRPHANQPAVQRFYAILRRFAGPGHSLMTCDCALRPPGPHQNAFTRHPLCANGRLFVMYRDLARNCSKPDLHSLYSVFFTALRDAQPELPDSDGVIGLTMNPTIHAALSTGTWIDGGLESDGEDPGYGYHLMLSFWAFGADEHGAWANLELLFRGLESAAEASSLALRAAGARTGTRPSIE